MKLVSFSFRIQTLQCIFSYSNSPTITHRTPHTTIHRHLSSYRTRCVLHVTRFDSHLPIKIFDLSTVSRLFLFPLVFTHALVILCGEQCFLFSCTQPAAGAILISLVVLTLVLFGLFRNIRGCVGDNNDNRRNQKPYVH